MTISPWIWIAVPALGGVIGYATNRIAVKMIFRPIRPVRVLGVRIQGLMPRRQAELATSIGRVVGGHLVEHGDIVQALETIDLEELVGRAIDRGLAPKIEELRKLPFVSGFLTDERVAELRAQFLAGILDDKQALFAELERAVESKLDVEQLVAEKVRGFPLERLEELILEVASRELRGIELLGGVLGTLIGLGQVGVLLLLG